MKKFLSIILIIALSITILCSCGADDTQSSEADINSTPYYIECSWCPNYGYVTGAIPNLYEPEYKKAAFYGYPLNDSELAEYLEELEDNFFERNPFSSGDMMVYSRDFNGESQSIVITVSRERNQVTIMAEDESK